MQLQKLENNCCQQKVNITYNNSKWSPCQHELWGNTNIFELFWQLTLQRPLFNFKDPCCFSCWLSKWDIVQLFIQVSTHITKINYHTQGIVTFGPQCTGILHIFLHFPSSQMKAGSSGAPPSCQDQPWASIWGRPLSCHEWMISPYDSWGWL